MACRSIPKSKISYDALTNEFPSMKSHLHLEELDVSNEDSINTFYNTIQSKYHHVDVIFNNAGIGDRKDIFSQLIGNVPNAQATKITQDTMKTNFFCTIKFTEKMLPLLSDDGKIIQMSSGLAKLQYQGSLIRQLMKKSTIDKEELLAVANQFIETVKVGESSKAGYTNSAYALSKALLNLYSWQILPTIIKKNQQIYICNPGWVRTDMGGEDAPESAEKGAETALYLIDLPFKYSSELQCKVFENKKVLP